MKITVIGTSALPTPPEAYGGCERVAYLTAKGLSEIGHDITLIAKEGSFTPSGGRLFPIADEKQTPDLVRQVGLDAWSDAFIDISHDKHLSRARPDLKILNNTQVMSDMSNGRGLVFISYGQWKGKFPNVQKAKVVYQPIDLSELKPYYGTRENYLLYMGQLIPEKRIEWACELAVRTNTPLRIFGPGWGDPEYHKMLYRYRDEHPDLISIKSDIGGEEKLHQLQHAKALVHPVGARNWCEAGAIVVLEALAVGTPCLVSDNGCLPEYIDEGVNGFVCHSVEELVDCLSKVGELDSDACRDSVKEHDYLNIARQYEAIITNGESW